MMTNFQAKILQRGQAVQNTKAHIRETLPYRGTSEAGKEAWQESCAAFYHALGEALGPIWAVTTEQMERDKDVRSYAFDFLAEDLIFFRSGYAKERLLPQVGRLTLSEAEKMVLRDVILARVQSGARREFRRFCRLIPKITNDGFVQALEHGAASEVAAVRHRARFALRYVRTQPPPQSR